MINLQVARYLGHFIILTFVYLISVTLTGYAKAWTAEQCGDSTAADYGFTSLNPMIYASPIGFLLLAFFGYGWGQPIPVDTHGLLHSRRGFFKIAAVYAAPIAMSMLIIGISLLVSILFFGGYLLAIASPLTLSVGPAVNKVLVQVVHSFISLNAFLIMFRTIWGIFDIILAHVFVSRQDYSRLTDILVFLLPFLLIFALSTPISRYLLYGVFLSEITLAKGLGLL